jgi:hypothetical protein
MGALIHETAAAGAAALRTGRYVRVRRGVHSAVKRIAPAGDFEHRVLDALAPGRDRDQARYEAVLRRARVRFAPTRFIGRDVMLQALVPGPNAKAWLAAGARRLVSRVGPTPPRWRALVAPLRDIAAWLARLADLAPAVRIDTALDNLIITARGPVLIDLFPPIFIERFPRPTVRRDRLLTELFVSPATQAAALVFYWFRPLVRQLVAAGGITHVAPVIDAIQLARTILRTTYHRPALPELGAEALAFFRCAIDPLADSAAPPEAWLAGAARDYLSRSFLAFVSSPPCNLHGADP